MELFINIWEYLRDVVTFKVRAAFLGVIDSSVVASFKESITGGWEHFKDVITFRVKAPVQEALDSAARKSFRKTATTGSRASTQKALDFSRKYVTLAQARAMAGTQATRNMLITGRQQLPGTVKRRFTAGLQVIIPLGVTILVLVWVFTKIDSILQPVISYIFGRTIPGVGFGITIVLILIAGAIVSNVAGRKAIHYGESVLLKIPGIRQLYSGVKQIVESFSSQGKGEFMQVVLVEFPKKGMKSVGFVTNEAVDPSGRTYLNVFIPTAPNPTSGFLQIMPEEEVIRTGISFDDALKMVISAGRVSAKEITEKLGQKTPEVTELESILEAQMDEKNPNRILQ